MHARSGAAGAASIPLLAAWSVIQGFVGFTSLYAFSAMLPALAAEPAIGPGRAGWIPWTVQLGLLLLFALWTRRRRAADRREVIALLALLAAGATLMSVAPSVGWLLVPSLLAGAGSLVWSAIHTIVTTLSATRAPHGATLTQCFGALMLITGALGRWGVIELTAQAGWRWACRGLAIISVTAALALTARWFRGRPSDATTAAAPAVAPRRGALVWGSLTCAAAGAALSALDYYEPAALARAGYAAWIGPLSFTFPLGGLLAALAMSALARQRGVAVVAAAALTLLGSCLSLLGQLAFADADWLRLLTLGRIAVETGAMLLTLSLAAIVAERYGNPDRYARTFAFWRALASTAIGIAAIAIWSTAAWTGITVLSVLAALIGLVGAIVIATTALARD